MERSIRSFFLCYNENGDFMQYTILVNKNHIWKEKDRNLISIKDINERECFLEEKAYEAYQSLQEYLKEVNIEIGIASAYRSLSEQKKLYEEKTRNKGAEQAKRIVAEPGYSEHHTALAIDIGIKVGETYIKEENEHTRKSYQEIHNVLSKFGFILRYPKDKEEITGYAYTPWHIRYVGVLPARIMKNKEITLEEYVSNFGTILYVNKPKGITSFDVVKTISHVFGIKKVGHTGTLDPMAEGVLLVTIGQATKIGELLTAQEKEYIAGVKLGVLTDTYDIEGTIIAEKEIPNHIPLQEVIQSYKKTYLQEVPIYSAVKVNGKKLYEYARKNQEVVLPKKEITIKKIELLNQEKDTFTFKALVSKGCYIRSLIKDIGDSLNTYATMTSLTRTMQGNISLEETNTLEEIESNQVILHEIEEVLDYPVIEVDEKDEKKLSNGMKIKDRWNCNDRVIFHGPNKKRIGIYEKDGDNLKTWKNFI